MLDAIEAFLGNGRHQPSVLDQDGGCIGMVRVDAKNQQ